MRRFPIYIGVIFSGFLLLLLAGTHPVAKATPDFPTPTPPPGMTLPSKNPNTAAPPEAAPPLVPTACGGQWTAVPSADLGAGTHDATLSGIAAVAADNIWAVGQYLDRNNIQHPVIEHWNGASWTVFSNPAQYGALNGITKLTPTDIWAVGTGLIEHWNGSQWSISPSPQPSVGYYTLYSLAGVAANDLWAVGVYGAVNNGAQTLVEHWDGSQWSVFPSPNPPGGYNEFYGVRALAADNVWAVGYYNINGLYSDKYPLIAHWDGTSWNTMSNPGTVGFTYLSDLAVVATNDIWAVGTVNTNTGSTPFEHWNGNSWDTYPSTPGGWLQSAAVLSPNNIWATGEYGNSTFVEQWDGAHWNVIASQNPGANHNTLQRVAAVDAGNVWAVGWVGNWFNRDRTPLIERYSNSPYYISNGDDSYQIIIAANCTGNINANFNLKRYYGPLADPNAQTGHIGPAALGSTVANNAQLKISYTARAANEGITVNFAGQAYNRRLTWSGGQGNLTEQTIEIQIPTSALVLPHKGTTTDPPPDALNPIVITGDDQGGITRIRLELRGMRPLVLMSGFNKDVTNPDNAETPGYFAWSWTNSALQDMLEMPNRNGHASIVAGGRTLAVKIDQIKTKYGVTKVNILGHSMGGLWGREFASNNRASIDKLMMLGTPNLGSIVADALAAGVVAACLRGPLDCAVAQAGYNHLNPAASDLRGSAVRAYNVTHGWVPGVTYVDQAGQTHSGLLTIPNDGAVSVSSEQALAYSTHLLPITKDQQGLTGIVHNQEPHDVDFRNAFVGYYPMGANRYGIETMPANTPGHSPLVAPDDPPPVAQYPAFVGSVQAGQTQTGTINIDNATSASFVLSWFNSSSTLSLTLHDPAGRVITPTTTYSGSSYMGSLLGVMYTVQNPLPGAWQVDVSGDVVEGSDESFSVAGELAGGVQITPVLTGFGAPGQPVTVSTTLSDTALLDGAILTATVSIPDSSNWNIAAFPLSGQGNGVYQGSFTPTFSGTHLITIFAQGINSQGQPFSRTQTTQVAVGSGATLTGNFSDWGYDTDGDSLYNSLVITATANVNEAGIYQLGGYLTKADGTVVAYSAATYTASVGINNLPLSFDGQEIGAAAADGPYQLRNLYFSRVLTDELGLALLPTAYTTAAYSRYSWQRDDTILAGPPTDAGVDTNGNGLYDYLEVQVPVDVRTPGTYSANLNLVAPDGSVITSALASNLTLVQGSNMLTLRFPGTAIGALGVNGPYQLEDLSLGGIGLPTTYIASLAAQTQAYQSTQFEGGAQPSPTPSPPAGQPSPTATTGGCSINFSDVQPTDYFYSPVQYLACHGVISGYADGTFRPYANTTRAQMVKIVVLGFARAIVAPPASNYTFADVPPSQPFFAYIETAAGAGIVNGYTCGGAGEPCDDQQRPYFRPYANVTRGQLAKIDAVAAGWTLLNPARPTFSDVAPGSAFYSFVETAVCHGVISGYGDGTFRPGANATRGQISKIVYLSISAGSSCSP